MDAKPLLSIRPATVEDVALVARLIRELAEYERLADAAVATEADLREQLFGERPAAEVLVAEADGEPAGFALFFHTFSTFLGKRGLYLEDLFVRPAFRRPRPRRHLMAALARIAVQRGCADSNGACWTGTRTGDRFLPRARRDRHQANGRCSGCRRGPARAGVPRCAEAPACPATGKRQQAPALH